MKQYKLLTPGPLTTTTTVKEEMLLDRCTWDDEYKEITQNIRKELLKLAHASSDQYTAVLMQGSGSFAVEAVMTTSLKAQDKALIITNGAYGKRIVKMAQYLGLNFTEYETSYHEYPDEEEIRGLLEKDESFTHIVMVHCETTTGILNPIEMVSQVAKDFKKKLIVDAMSSFGGIDIDVPALEIDYLISSANKCIQGVPGFGFVIAKIHSLADCKGNAQSLSLDLYNQWEEMDKDGKWRFTSPTHTVAAFSKALDELAQEGGVKARFHRYYENNKHLRDRMKAIGFASYVSEEKQSPIITSFLYPDDSFNFPTFYLHMKQKGFVIYPGKLTEVDTFRIGNIGEIYKDDIDQLCNEIEEFVGVKMK